MGIEDIKRKIIEDSESEAEAIIKEAQQKKEDALEEARRHAEEMKAEAIKKAHEEAERLIRTTVSQAELESIREVSDLERKMVTSVFKQALENLLSLNKDLLEDVLVSAILNSGSVGGEKVVLSKRFLKILPEPFIKKLNLKAREVGLKRRYRFSTQEATDADIELLGEGYRILISFEKILAEEGPELEKGVLQIIKGDREHV